MNVNNMYSGVPKDRKSKVMGLLLPDQVYAELGYVTTKLFPGKLRWLYEILQIFFPLKDNNYLHIYKIYKNNQFYRRSKSYFFSSFQYVIIIVNII